MPFPSYVMACLIACCFLQPSAGVFARGQRRVEQPAEVIEAYRVCAQFERIIGESLDFEQAYEATFTKNAARRRAVAIADGEFGELDFAGVDDATLINAYQRRMQIFYLVLPLAGFGETAIIFPPAIEQIIERKPPTDPRQFRAYAAQLERDVANFRSHLERLVAQYPSAAESLRQFKAEALRNKFAASAEGHKVEPQRGYGKREVLGENEPYYQIDGYTVARDNGEMKIVGVKFITRLF